ncbi:hypothetical protein QJS04_geneDACA023581 [Acorus gramineus]|uniref:Uncharacterized protein n=1 Tax=Acorus gramineus TaxID=55184 RepID=A0AAV8ZYT6_ACOGR|nr:hypothetical protein QJS04_geneDACA023581 [Acorus gramineus]
MRAPTSLRRGIEISVGGAWEGGKKPKYFYTGTEPPGTNGSEGRRGVVLREAGTGRICATRRWISVDRGSKVTLPLTMLRRLFKSSAKDSARRTVGIALHGDHE